MRISDWSSDVCSSDLQLFFRNGGGWVETLDADAQQELREDLLPRVVALPYVITVGEGKTKFNVAHAELMTGSIDQASFWTRLEGLPAEIGRASCRERVCQYV